MRYALKMENFNAKKIRLQTRYLKNLILEINTYLHEHSESEQAAEAKDRKLFAEKKLPELEELL